MSLSKPVKYSKENISDVIARLADLLEKQSEDIKSGSLRPIQWKRSITDAFDPYKVSAYFHTIETHPIVLQEVIKAIKQGDAVAKQKLPLPESIEKLRDIDIDRIACAANPAEGNTAVKNFYEQPWVYLADLAAHPDVGYGSWDSFGRSWLYGIVKFLVDRQGVFPFPFLATSLTLAPSVTTETPKQQWLNLARLVFWEHSLRFYRPGRPGTQYKAERAVASCWADVVFDRDVAAVAWEDSEEDVLAYVLAVMFPNQHPDRDRLFCANYPTHDVVNLADQCRKFGITPTDEVLEDYRIDDHRVLELPGAIANKDLPWCIQDADFSKIYKSIKDQMEMQALRKPSRQVEAEPKVTLHSFPALA
jgi:hypothetical protein